VHWHVHALVELRWHSGKQSAHSVRRLRCFVVTVAVGTTASAIAATIALTATIAIATATVSTVATASATIASTTALRVPIQPSVLLE
tara:strand:- start:233 stop:493 length:261 start_codon:yes stop_codon:yes gene_type:complete